MPLYLNRITIYNGLLTVNCCNLVVTTRRKSKGPQATEAILGQCVRSGTKSVCRYIQGSGGFAALYLVHSWHTFVDTHRIKQFRASQVGPPPARATIADWIFEITRITTSFFSPADAFPVVSFVNL